MTEEDEAFNEIERRAKQRMESVKATVNAKEALTKLLVDSYDQGVKDALESVTQASNELQVAGYERGFIDGMQKQAQSSVDKAVNAMSQRTWVGLTPEEFHEACWESYVDPVTGECSTGDREYAVSWTEAKLKEKNT